MPELLNASLNNTLADMSGKITFDQAYTITSSTPFIAFLLTTSVLIIIMYLIFGACADSRTPSGKKIEGSKAISSANFWMGFVILFFGLLMLNILTIFPIWLLIFQ